MKTRRNQSLQAREWLTVPQAARILGVARPTVLQKALLGELRYKTFAGDVFIAAASVEAAEQSAAA